MRKLYIRIAYIIPQAIPSAVLPVPWPYCTYHLWQLSCPASQGRTGIFSLCQLSHKHRQRGPGYTHCGPHCQMHSPNSSCPSERQDASNTKYSRVVMFVSQLLIKYFYHCLSCYHCPYMLKINMIHGVFKGLQCVFCKKCPPSGAAFFLHLFRCSPAGLTEHWFFS